MPNYKPDFTKQAKFIPVDFTEQIIPDTFEYALNHIVNPHLDLRPFDSLYNNEQKGAAAYSPSVMLKIILFAYAHGMISSRRIAKACQTNITDNDSAKMLTNKGTIQGYNGVAISDDKHQIIVQAQAWDAVNEQQTLQPAIKQLQGQLSRIGKTTSLQQAKFSADSGFHSKANLVYLDEQGIDSYIADTGFRSRNPLFQNSQTYQATKRKKRGYDKPKLFTRDDFHFNRQALSCVCPAGNVMWLTSKKPHTNNDQRYITYQGYLKDCRTCPMQSQCMRSPPKERGRQVTFTSQDKPTKIASIIQQMKDKIDSKQGRREYSKRLGCIEPVFANITKHKKMDYFTLRGKTKVNTQWLMYCLVHNIEKLREHVA
ncbi:transposase [Glaciecola sp. KUL10]|uniref:transposase n=1 Tax=Glaciecola sp. (strain KUL10) TaxID=2161813 RepID=UPI000D78AA29|nr:transposase [Glaciecola sp. KUL10]GBL03500.1 transposase IS4 family protein [Glaciecola sp. KUL10]